MNAFFIALGGLFVFLGVFFLLGLLPWFAPRFYPGRPNVVARSAASVIFALLALACFRGAGLAALLTVVVAGGFQIAASRRKKVRVGR